MFKPKHPIAPSDYARKIKKVGDFRREKARLDYEAYKKDVLSKARPVDEDLALREIGNLKVQVIYQPSFETNYVWDIREKTANAVKSYELYESKFESTKTIAPGYKKVEISSNDLLQLLNEIYSTKVSLAISPMRGAGLDGTRYGLNIYENYYRVIKIAWWEKPQEELLNLNKVLQKYIEIFINLKEKSNIG